MTLTDIPVRKSTHVRTHTHSHTCPEGARPAVTGLRGVCVTLAGPVPPTRSGLTACCRHRSGSAAPFLLTEGPADPEANEHPRLRPFSCNEVLGTCSSQGDREHLLSNVPTAESKPQMPCLFPEAISLQQARPLFPRVHMPGFQKLFLTAHKPTRTHAGVHCPPVICTHSQPLPMA